MIADRGDGIAVDRVLRLSVIGYLERQVAPSLAASLRAPVCNVPRLAY